MKVAIFTDTNRPEHLQDKYRVYALRFEDESLLLVHVGRPISLKTFCEQYVFKHLELLNKTENLLFQTSKIKGVEKVLNSNKPDFELTMEGQLIEIT